MCLSDIKTAIRHWFCFFFHAIVWKAKRCKNSRKMRHVQKICYQGQDRFQWSSTKSIHVQPIFSLGQNNVVTFKKLPFKGKRSLALLSTKNLSQFHASFHINPKFPVMFQQHDLSRSSRECCQQTSCCFGLSELHALLSLRFCSDSIGWVLLTARVNQFITFLGC